MRVLLDVLGYVRTMPGPDGKPVEEPELGKIVTPILDLTSDYTPDPGDLVDVIVRCQVRRVLPG